MGEIPHNMKLSGRGNSVGATIPKRRKVQKVPWEGLPCLGDVEVQPSRVSGLESSEGLLGVFIVTGCVLFMLVDAS